MQDKRSCRKYAGVLVVESPTKAKLLKKYFPQYNILSTKGHFRVLPPKKNSISIDKNLNFHWKVMKSKIDPIKKALEKTPHLIIATDLDREGEGIGYHLLEECKDLKFTYDRIQFTSITKNSITEAIEKPKKLNFSLVRAYLSRVFLDFYIGFNLSPLLCKFVGFRLSSGRVQNPSIELLLQKAFERKNFVPTTTYSLVLKNPLFIATYGKKNLSKNELNDIEKTLNNSCEVTAIITKTKNIKSKAPFITTSLQRAAASQFGYSVKKTMNLAQKLYEGVEINGELQALITYMRTDSTAINKDFQKELRSYIKDVYPNYLNKNAKIYNNKSGSQEAHECIRIINLNYRPCDLDIPKDLLNIYRLIWNRTLSSQMTNATLESRKYLLNNGGYNFTFSYSHYTLPSFMIFKPYKKEPLNITVGDKFEITKEVITKVTKPPANYSEATLIETLENLGIGRPSTYGGLIDTLRRREYVNPKGPLEITPLGMVVGLFNRNYFPNLIDSSFTENMEIELSKIANSEDNAENISNHINFVQRIIEHIQKTMKNLDGKKRIDILTHISQQWNEYKFKQCDLCQSPISIRSKFSLFVYCEKCDVNININSTMYKNSDMTINATKKYKQLYYKDKKVYLHPKLENQWIWDHSEELIQFPIKKKDVTFGSSYYGFYKKKDKKKYELLTWDEIIKAIQ